MEQLAASVTLALVLLALVVRDVLIDHGVVVRATDRTRETLRRNIDELERTTMEDDLHVTPGGAQPPATSRRWSDGLA